MLRELDGRLKDWVADVIPGVELSLVAPDAKKTGRGIGLYLLELLQSPAPSAIKRPPLQLTLRYLISAWSDEPEDAHQMLADLMFAAMENADFQVELEPIPLTVWTAFGLPPRPSFILRVSLRRERTQPQAKLVREPLRVQVSALVSFHGVLLGPGNIPLSDCRVELPALGLWATTDPKGRFHFASVPSQGAKRFLIKAKGLELPISSERNYPDSGTPLVIHFSPLEG
jgi:hypothetical protein